MTHPRLSYVPDLNQYDVVLINTSAGKDSQTMMRQVVLLAHEQGCPSSKLVAVHAALGERVEWDGTVELAAEQVSYYGLRFEVVSRIGVPAPKPRWLVGSERAGSFYAPGLYLEGEHYGDLLDYVERRGRWMDMSTRFCTSEFKRSPIANLVTKLVNEVRERKPKGHQVKVLNCMGMRAEESPKRAEMDPFTQGVHETSTRRQDNWLPIQDWTTEEVWTDILESEIPYHWAYDRGMGRLSCVFCPLEGREDLWVAASLNPEKLEAWAATERITVARHGHTFMSGYSFAKVQSYLAEHGPVERDSTARGSICSAACDACATGCSAKTLLEAVAA